MNSEKVIYLFKNTNFLLVVLMTLDENIDEDLLYEQFVAIDTNNVNASTLLII
jgi:hypothetical protein